MKAVREVGWVIVYIRGAEGFQDEVLPKLRDSYLSGNLETDSLLMIWIPGVERLRSLKIAIGSRIILKYRLQFSTSVHQPAKISDSPSLEFPGPEPETSNQMTVSQNKDPKQGEMLIE